MKTLSAINHKGGTAKTTTNLALGAYLTGKGKKVLYVDLDPQQNLCKTLGADLSLPTSLEVLVGDVTISEAIQKVGKYAVVPSSKRAGKVDQLIDDVGRDYRLKNALDEVSSSYDYAIIDTPPALGTLVINCLTACDGIVIPAQADIYSVDGLEDLASTIASVRKYTNPDLKVLGILLTRYSPRTNISQVIYEMASQRAEEFGTKVFKSTIREAVAIREAQAVGQDIFSYAGKSKVASDYEEFAKEAMKAMKK